MFTMSEVPEPISSIQITSAADRFIKQQAEAKAAKSWWPWKKSPSPTKKKDRQPPQSMTQAKKLSPIDRARDESRKLWRDSMQYKRRIEEVRKSLKSAKFDLARRQEEQEELEALLLTAKSKVEETEQEILRLEGELDKSQEKWGESAVLAREARKEARKLREAEEEKLRKTRDAVIFAYEKQQRIMLRGSSRWWLFLLGFGVAAGGVAALLKHLHIF